MDGVIMVNTIEVPILMDSDHTFPWEPLRTHLVSQSLKNCHFPITSPFTHHNRPILK